METYTYIVKSTDDSQDSSNDIKLETTDYTEALEQAHFWSASYPNSLTTIEVEFN